MYAALKDSGHALGERYPRQIQDIDILPPDYFLYDEQINEMSVLAENINGKKRKDSEGRISLAYEKLIDIPKSIADRFASTTKILDLSHNRLSDLSFLINFTKLHSLILDKNSSLDVKTLPHLPNLTLLWLNHCDILNLTKWIRRIQTHCQSLKYLSLLGNPSALSLFNGNSMLEHNDYRLYVIGQLPSLLYLDDSIITPAQRAQAKSHRYLHGLVSVLSFIGSKRHGDRVNSRKFNESSSTESEKKRKTKNDNNKLLEMENVEIYHFPN